MSNLNSLEGEFNSKGSSLESPEPIVNDGLLDSQFVSIMRVWEEDSVEKDQENKEPNLKMRETLAKL